MEMLQRKRQEILKNNINKQKKDEQRLIERKRKVQEEKEKRKMQD